MVNFTMLVRDRPRLTTQALLSLTPKIVGKDMNITILDDRSEKETGRLVKQWAALNDAYAIRQIGQIGTGHLRNFVIQNSEIHFGRGELLYLSDNDVFFENLWLETLVRCYDEAWKFGFKVIGAYCHPYHQPIENQQWVKVGEYDVKPVHALALQSMLMRWEVWDKYGPFCDTPVDKVCQSEDVDFTNKIHADGFKIGVVSPALIVSTGITNTFGEKIPGWELVKAQCPDGIICE